MLASRGPSTQHCCSVLRTMHGGIARGKRWHVSTLSLSFVDTRARASAAAHVETHPVFCTLALAGFALASSSSSSSFSAAFALCPAPPASQRAKHVKKRLANLQLWTLSRTLTGVRPPPRPPLCPRRAHLGQALRPPIAAPCDARAQHPWRSPLPSASPVRQHAAQMAVGERQIPQPSRTHPP